MTKKIIAQRDENVKKISIYRDSYDTTGTQCSLDAIFQRIRTGEKELKQKTKKARTLATSDPIAYKAFKASHFPAPTFAGIFPQGKRQASHLAQHSGYIVLDIDDVPPLTLYALTAHLNKRTDLHLAFISPSGTGIKLVVNVSPTPQNAAEHTAAFNYVLAYFSTKIAQFNISFDESGKDCSRLCYLAYDPQVIYAPHAAKILWDRDAYLAKLTEKAKRTEKTAPIAYEGQIDIKALDYIDPDYQYDQWIDVGMACKNAGLDFAIWDTWSRRGEKYQEQVMQRKWDSFSPGQLTWGTVVYLATANGYVPPHSKRSDRRLSIDTTATESRKAALAAPSDVQTALNNDIIHAIDTPQTATPQFTIFPQDTGTGKSTTMLTHSYNAEKRVISLLFNHKLATQQTETARDLGFNSYRFRGRGYNFDKMPLDVKHDIRSREENETLFDKYNVMCPIYDKVEKHTAKRITPLFVCFRCKIRETCETRGYWSQYADIQQADYLSICSQDLPFNPDLWALLYLLQSGKTPFDNTSESTEEKAIAYMLGLDTETETETKNFDFAVVDDYTASGLYTDVTYTIEELATLLHAWRGTRTGEIIEKIFEAIWELWKHKKDENTSTAIALLRGLFENMDTETRGASDENLTKHAARDPNGEITPVSPVKALKQGVPLEKLTPVWHSKRWTLLHQLEAMLTHCKNDAQAPFFSDGDTITFTIPPQIHTQLNKVLFMSATADIDATQNAFDGKDVSWRITRAKQPRLAAGVQMFQYTNSRMTAGSIFEYERDASGNVVYDHDNKPARTGKITPRSEALLKQIIALVRTSSEKSAFIGYKEFVEGQITELPAVKQLHDGFDTVTHFDITQGLNFDDYKIFVIFGYPKADHRTIKLEARRQYAHDPQPLCFDYEYVTATDDGYTSEARRFSDARVEKIRQQLTTDKLKQAIGRARHGRWKDTVTLVVTSEPVPSYTGLAAPVTYQDIMTAEKLEDIGTHKPSEEIAPQISSTADNISQLKEQHPHMTQTEIATQIGITQPAVSQALKLQSNNYKQMTQVPLSTLHGDRVICLYNVTLKEQILNFLKTGEAKTADIIKAVDGKPYSVKNELRRLVDAGTIKKLRHGVYNVPQVSMKTAAAWERKITAALERKIATGEIHRDVQILKDISETQKTHVTERCIALLTDVISRHREHKQC